MTTPTRREPPLARLVGRRPKRGATDAAKTVVTDVQQLLRAEIDLAKAEVTEGVKAKVMGAGFFIGAAIVGWLAIQAFLVFLGFLFALIMPGWAASGLVLLLLLILIGVLGFLGMRKLQQEASLAESKASIEQSKAAASAAVEQAKENAATGVDEAKGTVLETVSDVRERLEERVNRLKGDTGASTHAGNGQARIPATPLTPIAAEAPMASSAPAASPAPAPAVDEPVQMTDLAPAETAEMTGAPAATSVRPMTMPATGAADGISFPDPPRSAEEA